MRDAPASIDTMLAGTALTLARCVKLRLRDNSELGFIDLDRDVTVALDDDLGYPVEYRAGRGVISGDISLNIRLEADNSEIRIPIGDDVTRAAVKGRRFNQATVWIFDIDHTQDDPAPLALMKGTITESSIEEAVAVFEVRSQADFWNVTIGSVLTPRCRADFGDEQCGVALTWITTTVTAAANNMAVTLDLAGDHPDDYFRYGAIEFLTGELADLPEMEVVDYTGATGALECFAPLAATPQVGDQVRIRRGCSRLKSSDDESLPTCLSYDNVTRFRGFDRVPGSDVYLKIPTPGSGGA